MASAKETARTGVSRRARAAAGRPELVALLARGTPREILARIVPDDPLGLRERVRNRLRERAFLLDVERVHLRALARCASRAPRYRGRPALDVWLDRRVEEAIEDVRLLCEEPPGEPSDETGRLRPDAIEHFAAALGLDAAALREGLASFHELPAGEREVFFRLVLEGGSLDEVARALKLSGGETARRARRAFEAVLTTPAVPAQDARRDGPQTPPPDLERPTR